MRRAKDLRQPLPKLPFSPAEPFLPLPSPSEFPIIEPLHLSEPEPFPGPLRREPGSGCNARRPSQRLAGQVLGAGALV